MKTIIALVIASVTVLVKGFTPDIQDLKNDYIVRPAGNHRLAGILMLGNNNKCDVTRPKIRTFGYCWDDKKNEEQGIDTTEYKGWVGEVIQQWAKCGGIKFVEEKTCREGPDFVTIHVGNYHPVLYPRVDTRDCTILNFNMYINFYTFGENTEYYRTTEKVRKSMIQMYVLHEFGHFLGFDHEHNRSDRKDECDIEVDKTNVGPDAVFGTNIITKQYDLDSIMNYCRPNVHWKPWLSEFDKQGIKQKYGGGNQQECDAATKPWKWGPGEGVEDYVLEQLNGGGSSNGNNGDKPTPKPTPGVCADVHPECESRKASCGDEAMKYWCPKTCKYC